MTPPRTLGATAKVVLESVEQDLVVINDALFGAVEVMATDQTRAIGLLSQAASRNTYALRALTLLRADRMADAQNVVMDSRLRGHTK